MFVSLHDLRADRSIPRTFSELWLFPLVSTCKLQYTWFKLWIRIAGGAGKIAEQWSRHPMETLAREQSLGFRG